MLQQTWRTFLANHMDVRAACDFSIVPTLSFKLLYVFVVLSPNRRRILHVNVTEHPRAEWTAQQLTEAFPGDNAMPRYLHRDRDSIYADFARRRIASLGMNEVISAKKSPWQNPFAERVIGSIRRECTDHLVSLNEAHLRSILGKYVAYYNRSRCHQSLDGKPLSCPDRYVRMCARLRHVLMQSSKRLAKSSNSTRSEAKTSMSITPPPCPGS